MADRTINSFLGLSPTREVESPDFFEIFELEQPLGTSPETWMTMAIRLYNMLKVLPVAVSASKTLALSDMFTVQRVTISSSPPADVVITVPTNATAAFPIGTIINITLVDDGGASPANKVTVTGATGVIINGTSAGSVNVAGNFAAASMQKVAENTWDVVGGIS